MVKLSQYRRTGERRLSMPSWLKRTFDAVLHTQKTVTGTDRQGGCALKGSSTSGPTDPGLPAVLVLDETRKSQRQLVSKRLAEFADRPWVGSWEIDSVDRGLAEAANEATRLAAAKQYVTIQICDSPIERMKPILKKIAQGRKESGSQEPFVSG